MNTFDAARLCFVIEQISGISVAISSTKSAVTTSVRAIQRIGGTPTSDIVMPVESELAKLVHALLEEACSVCASIGLTDAESKLSFILGRISLDKSRHDFSSLPVELDHAKEAITSDLKKRTFIYVKPEVAKYVDDPNLMGKSVADAFRSAVPDIVDAGNCLAADCNTAAVFHLMRVAEYGLRALAKDRRVVIPKGPLELATWEQIIQKIEDAEAVIQKQPKTSAREAQFDFYHGAAMEFKRFKNKFRNKIMHARDSYDADEAHSAFIHVRAFMQTLSGKISETKRTPVIWKRP